MTSTSNILYVGAKLPSRSETFVYREVFELRRRGVNVHTATANQPDKNLGSDELDQLADDALLIYPHGLPRLLLDAGLTTLTRPASSLKTIVCCVKDALFGKGVPLKRKPKLLVQGIAGLALVRRLNQAGFIPNHVHAHMAHVPTSIAMYAAMALDVPFSFTGHAADLFRDFSLVPAKLERASFVACISEWHRDYYKSQAKSLNDSTLPIVRCGVDTSQFEPAVSNANGPIRILSVGRLVEKKGFDVLINACAILKSNGYDFHCTIAGDGPEGEHLARLVEEQGLGECVDLPGSKTNDEVRELMMEADTFVLPCREAKSGDKDGIPVVLMEAMACGLPVVSGDLVTIRELIFDRKTGLMVAPEDTNKLANAIETLINDGDLRHELATNGRQRVIDEFSLTENVDRLTGAFECKQQVSTRNTSEQANYVLLSD